MDMGCENGTWVKSHISRSVSHPRSTHADFRKLILLLDINFECFWNWLVHSWDNVQHLNQELNAWVKIDYLDCSLFKSSQLKYLKPDTLFLYLATVVSIRFEDKWKPNRKIWQFWDSFWQDLFNRLSFDLIFYLNLWIPLDFSSVCLDIWTIARPKENIFKNLRFRCSNPWQLSIVQFQSRRRSLSRVTRNT
jgi:hypothetical protein